jgi:hypothetical protein
MILMINLPMLCPLPCPVFVWGPPGLLATGSCNWIVLELRSLNAAFPCWYCLLYFRLWKNKNKNNDQKRKSNVHRTRPPTHSKKPGADIRVKGVGRLHIAGKRSKDNFKKRALYPKGNYTVFNNKEYWNHEKVEKGRTRRNKKIPQNMYKQQLCRTERRHYT